jgi:large subunit ribosomal protein L7/L12
MADINTIAEELGKLTILEAAELVKMLEEKWGVSAAAPVAAAATSAIEDDVAYIASFKAF